MSMPWEDAANAVQQVPAELFNKENRLSAMTAGPNFQKEEEAWITSSEGANPAELDAAIQNAKTPWHAAALQQTKDDFEAVKAKATKPQDTPKETMPWENAAKEQEDPYPNNFAGDLARSASSLAHKAIIDPIKSLANTKESTFVAGSKATLGALKVIPEFPIMAAGQVAGMYGNGLNYLSAASRKTPWKDERK